MQQNSYWQPSEPQHDYRIRTLIFGAVSFLFCQLPLIPVGTGIVAVVYASKSRKQGNGNNTAIVGMVLGIIGICVGAIATIYWAIYFLGILAMLYQETDLIPAPSNPEFYEQYENPGQPALLWRWKFL